MIKRLIWTIWTPMSSVLKKADKLNLSLSLKLDLPKGEHIQPPTGYAIVPHIDEYAGDVTLLSIPHTQGRPVLMQGYLKNRGSKMYIRP